MAQRQMSEPRRIPSERTLFERWLTQWSGIPREQIRADRAEFGYESRHLDYAFAAWKARGDRRQLCRRTI